MTVASSADSEASGGWGIANRTIVVLLSHGGFTAAIITIVLMFYPDRDGRNGMLLAFLAREAIVLVVGLYALFATATGARAIASSFARALVRARPLVPLVENLAANAKLKGAITLTRWIALWLSITAGFIASGTLIVSTGGFQASPFVQLPMTMVVLGAMMSDKWPTALGVFVYGSLYALLLAFRPWPMDILLGVYDPGVANSDHWLVLLITGLNLFIGVAASYLASGQSDRS